MFIEDSELKNITTFDKAHIGDVVQFYSADNSDYFGEQIFMIIEDCYDSSTIRCHMNLVSLENGHLFFAKPEEKIKILRNAKLII